MANVVSVDFKRNLLRGLAWDAQDQNATLESVLKAACRARVEETRTGKILVSVAGNGAQAQFALPQSASALTPDAIDIACEQLYSLYENTLTELAADGNESPTDAQIVTRMLTVLIRRNEVYTDRSQVCVR